MRVNAARPLQIQRNVSLKDKNTFKLNVRAKEFVVVESEQQLETLVQDGVFDGDRVLLLGRGANILFSKDFDGLVVLMRISGREVIAEDDETVTISVGAGEDWPELVADVVMRGWGGIENLALVPGTAGAAVVQHIACYGHNLKDVIVCVRAIRVTDGAQKIFTKPECEFGYRDSIFRHRLKQQYVITNIVLRLSKKPVPNISYHSRYESLEGELKATAVEPYTIRDVYNAVVNIRRRKLPDIHKIGSAGSFFKNPVVSHSEFVRLRKICPGLQSYPAEQLSYPRIQDEESLRENKVKIPAGWLIQELRLPKTRIGDCGIWGTQGLVIVNYGCATPSQLLDFVEKIRESVLERYGIFLENEVEVI